MVDRERGRKAALRDGTGDAKYCSGGVESDPTMKSDDGDGAREPSVR